MTPSATRPPGRPPARRAGAPPPSPRLLPPLLLPLPGPLHLVVGLCVLLSVQQLAAGDTCGPGLSTPGVTIPNGDIILQEGDLLELYCVLNLTHLSTKGRNATHLRFYRQNTLVGPEYLQVLNETTLKLTMRPNVSSSMYYCKLAPWKTAQEEVVCLNNVAVGYPPLDVSDFSCVSQNWQNLTCTWKKKLNPVKTRYTIWYRLPGRAGGRTKYACPDDSDLLRDRCQWAENSNPQYRLPYESYLFMIEGINHLSNATFNHKFNHYANVIPGKPEDLKVKNKTAYSAYLEWSLPYPMPNFPPGLIHRIEYLPQWESRGSRETWHRVDTDKLDTKDNTKLQLNITSLKYAYTLYDIRVYLKSAKANPHDDKLWSAPAGITVKTKPDIPGAPPRTDIGSFEVLNHRDSREIYIYWQTIPEFLQNGDEFGYKIMDIEDNVDVSKKWRTEMTKKQAKLSKVDLNKSLRLRIASVNKEGQSVNSSEIIIPDHRHIPKGPGTVTKVFYENGTYELSWKAPATEENNIHSYTIFWCDSIYDNMCTGYLNWTHVPSNITVKNMTVEDDKSYQFAVSANTLNASSGMVWASCTILYNKSIQKMKNVWVKRVGSTFMELIWNLDCLDSKSYVVGFRVYYCPALLKGTECKTPNQNVTVQNPAQSSLNLTGLRPYTTYSISIAVLSGGGESLPSDPLLNVTLEAAPSPPQNVSIVNITNTSITVSWNVPEEKNGVITKYEVHYDGKVLTKNNDNQKKQEVVLENLTSFYNYSISVAACTFACSDPSPPLLAETKIGEPGVVNAPNVAFLNQSQLLVTWDHPVRPSGLLDYYEVNISHPGGDNFSSEIRETLNTSLQVRIDGCSERLNEPYSFTVRAVNVDPNNPNIKYKGKWSASGEGSCYTNDLPLFLKITIYILMVSVCSLISWILIVMGKKLYEMIKTMKNVEVVLPPGLDKLELPSPEQDFKLHQWVTHNHDSKPSHGLFPAADEERLLQQKDEHHHDRNLSGDSSGCSSGHESVSSSATSGTHISSDSGTEVDRSEPGFGDPSWDANSDSGSTGGAGSGSGGGQRQVAKWDEPYACVGVGVGSGGSNSGAGKAANSAAVAAANAVRSTPNLSELEPGYTLLASWPSSGSIPDKKQLPLQPQPCGYVPLDTAQALPMPAMVPVPVAVAVAAAASAVAEPAKPAGLGQGNGYVAHPPTSLMWAPQPATPTAKGYVKTGRGAPASAPKAPQHAKEAFTPECEGSWEEPFQRLGQQQQQQQQQQVGGYVKAGECVGMRPSRTEPALSSSLGLGGYVVSADPALLRHKVAPGALAQPHAAPAQHHHLPASAHGPQTVDLLKQQAASAAAAARASAASASHEYVLTGDRDVAPNAPLVVLDPVPPKAYCRVSERDRDSVPRPVAVPPPVVPAVPKALPVSVPLAMPMASPMASSGYVPHRHLEVRNAPSVAE